MIIPLNDKYRITSDPHCWRVEKYKGVQVKDGKLYDHWVTTTFHPTITSAVQGFYEDVLRSSPADSIEEVCKVVKETQEFIKDKWSQFDEALRHV